MERAMLTRRLSLILPLLVLPALIGCGSSEPAPLPPLSDAALAAVVKSPGVSRKKLARAVDALFSDPEAEETRAVLVLQGGRVIAERYGEGYHENTRFVSWSMAKSITGVMIGLLVSDGRLRLDETAPVPAWQRSGDPRGEITLRQLLQMRSGLRHTETADPLYKADTVRMLFLDGRDDMAAYAEAQPLEEEPGRTFEYSSATTVILADLAARALTESRDPAVRRQAVTDYLRTRLFEPLGLKSMVPEFDAAGTLIGGSLIHGNARDWAKFGEFLRNEGSVKGAQIIPRAWIEFMTAPSPRNPGYGVQIWLNRPQSDGSEVLFPGRGPASIFACIGHLGQYVIVSPSQKLTVVRLGKTQDEERGALRNRLADIVSLFPRS
jgi:CubicO group peptidase (beta-lactamase class C family)